jgi:hypothetical protein
LLTVRSAIQEPTEWQRVGNQIDAAAMIVARADFVSVHQPQRWKLVFQSQVHLACLRVVRAIKTILGI